MISIIIMVVMMMTTTKMMMMTMTTVSAKYGANWGDENPEPQE